MRAWAMAWTDDFEPTGYDRDTLEAMVQDMWIDCAYDAEAGEEIRDEMDAMSTERLAMTLHSHLGQDFPTLYREYL